MYCPRCGREALSGAAFCIQCGAALEAPATAATLPATEPMPMAAVSPVADTPTPAFAPAAVRYAGFWRRFGAFWIDGILLMIAGMLVQLAMGLDFFDRSLTDPRAWAASGISFLMGWFYSAFLESGKGQATLGQMVIGIKVTDLAGRRVSFARATGRHFAQILSALILFMGYVMVAFTEKKQGLHDLMSGCLIVRAAN
jgi:uncharacterized RDD family membrane protein YckC